MCKIFCKSEFTPIFAHRNSEKDQSSVRSEHSDIKSEVITKKTRRISSAGSEHLPYKQRVTGSNPVFSTKSKRRLSSAGSEHLPYKQRVTGSNPVASTTERKASRN